MSNDINYSQAQQEMHTLLDMLRWATTTLAASDLHFGHGTDNPWDEAASLILPLLNLPFDMPESVYQARLTSDEKAMICDFLQQRIEQRIPVPYLIKQAWFCDMPFYVDERVLVPRSPFAELIKGGFTPWVKDEPGHILDMCTGSGCIAIALATLFEDAQVDAVDISADALTVAETNIYQHQVEDRVWPIQSNLFTNLAGHEYDLIICNPPYVDEDDMSDLPDEFKHEPELGLAAGNDGLDLVRTILQQAPLHLSDNGWLFVEVGNSQVHMQAEFPELNLEWIELEMGGHGLFAINKRDLLAVNSH